MWQENDVMLGYLAVSVVILLTVTIAFSVYICADDSDNLKKWKGFCAGIFVYLVSMYFWLKVYSHYRQMSRRIHPALEVVPDQQIEEEEQWV